MIFGEGLREGAKLPPFRGLSSGVAGEAVSLPAFSSGFAVGCGFLEQCAQRLHVEVAAAVDPFLVGLDGERADEPQATRLVSEDADDVGAAFKLLIEAFEQIGRFGVFMMRGGQPVICEGLLDVGFDPGAQFRVLVLPACEPGLQIGARLRGIAAVVEPA